MILSIAKISKSDQISLFAIALLTVAQLMSPPNVNATPAGFVYPLMGTRVSSNFGVRQHPVLKRVRHHGGIDLAAPHGAPIRAVKEGTVVFADPHGSYGRLVVIAHDDGLTSHYGHCDSISVKTGQHIRAGQVLGTVGSSGRVTGPHLHFEIRRAGTPLNPESMIPDLAAAAQG